MLSVRTQAITHNIVPMHDSTGKQCSLLRMEEWMIASLIAQQHAMLDMCDQQAKSACTDCQEQARGDSVKHMAQAGQASGYTASTGNTC